MLQKNNLVRVNSGMKMMQNNSLKIRSATSADNKWLEELMNRDWGGLPLVIRGGKFYPSQLDGIIAENEER